MSFMTVEKEERKTREQSDLAILHAYRLTGNTVGIFTECLHQAGISRGDIAEIYMTDDDWEEQLKEIKPRVLLTVDDKPLSTLTHRTSSFSFRGSPIFKDDYIIIPLMRLALCLGVYTNRYFIVSDLRKALRIASTENYKPVHRDYIIFPEYQQVVDFLQNILDKHKEVAFDIECCNQQVSCISFAPNPFVSICIPFYGNVWTEGEEIVIWRLIGNILYDKSITKIGQNVMFDISFLARQNDIVTRGLIEDSMIGHNTIYKDFPKGLDFLGSIYTDEEYYKDDGKIWKDPSKDLRTFYIYSAKDSAITFACWEAIKKELHAKNFMPLYRRIMSVFQPLLAMQLEGMNTDHKELEARQTEVGTEILSKQKELDAMYSKQMGIPNGSLNVKSPKQKVTYFYGVLGHKPYMNKGKVTTNEKAMSQLARKGVPEAQLLQRITKLRDLKSRYLDIAFDADGRLRSSYNLAGTSFGRLASSQTIFGTGTNFQNIPPEFRTFMIADPGYCIVELDKAQAEWIVVAYLANDANMIEVASNSNIDAHARTAKLMFGAPEELIKTDDKLLKDKFTKKDILMARKKELPEILKYNPIDSMSCRQIGKKCNHGLNYDLGANGFSVSSEIELGTSKRIVQMYHNAYPGVRNTYHSRVRDQLGKDRSQTNCFGRKRIFMDRWGDTLFKAAYACIPQGSVGDLVNIAIREIYNDNSRVMHKVDMLGQVHDSIVFQYPLDSLPDLYYAIKICKEYMDIPMSYNARKFVIPTDVKIGLSWGGAKELPNADYKTIEKIWLKLKEESNGKERLR